MLSTFHQLYTVLIDLLCLNNTDNWNSASMLILYYAMVNDTLYVHQLYPTMIDLICLDNADSWNSASMSILDYTGLHWSVTD